jgi:DDE superfamily endonuclease
VIKETHTPLPAEPGQPARYDYDYERNGTRTLFLFVEPQAGWRPVVVTEQRTMIDFAQQMKGVVDERYPQADKVRVVLDNLNTHRPASLYEAFPPEEARRILTQLEFPHTPKHGSWLNLAEIEFSVLQRQGLDRRRPNEPALTRAVAAWETHRNAQQATIDWRFSVTDARKKLQRLYPSPSLG